MSYLFSTSSNSDLAKHLIQNTPLKLGKFTLDRFADGEILFELQQDVSTQETYVLGSSYPPAENLLELFTIINTLKINKAKKITVIAPYLGYAKSDHTDRKNQPINAALFAKFLEIAGADHVITCEPHGKNIFGFFTIPFTALSTASLFAEYLESKITAHTTIATPDLGGLERSVELAKTLNIKNKIIVIEKKRPSYDQAVITNISGNAKGKDIVIIDDLIQTGNTIFNAAQALKEQGASKIYVAITHFCYSANALEKISADNLLTEFITTNTIPFPKTAKQPKNFTILPVNNLLANYLNDLISSITSKSSTSGNSS